MVEAQQRERTGYVYLLKVIGHDSLYKIGRAKNPRNRLRTFNVKLPFPVKFTHLIQSSDMYELEKKLHRKYQATRQQGSEFFKLTSENVQEIKLLGLHADADDVVIPEMNFTMKQKAKADSYQVIELDTTPNTKTKKRRVRK